MIDAVIAVPIHLDALYLKKPCRAIPPMADFTRLPYFEGQRDVNATVPWLGEAAALEAFASETTVLQKGIHLHWRFPKALTTGTQSAAGKVTFPALPDRWLVTRGRETGGTRVVEDQWVIESDYQFADGISAEGAAYPIWTESVGTQSGRGRCFRYMGRAWPLNQWCQRTDRNTERTPLTAVGYGEPSFASFYPNCSNMFGFHDPQYAEKIPDGLYYQVIGWYRNLADDYLQVLIKQTPDTRRPGESKPTQVEKILEELRWSVKGDAPIETVTACQGSVIFHAAPDPLAEPQLETPVVTFGATITEALSAYLANEVADGDSKTKELIEDQLEAIMLDPALSSRTVDLAAKFKEARHAKGFDEVFAGSLWTIREETSAEKKEESRQTAVPWPDVAERLGVLNQLQQDYDQAWDEIRAMRGQLYSDWTRYMWRSYSPPDVQGSYPNISEVRFIIERQTLPQLERRLADAGLLVANPDKSERLPQASRASKKDSLARKIERELTAILESLASHRWTSLDKTRYVVQTAVAPRYWRPTEPVILLTGKVVRVNEPVHVEDIDGKGLLACEVLRRPDLELLLRTDPSTFLSSLRFKPRVWTEQPWHPFLLHWEVELTPVKNAANLSPLDESYDEKFITRPFTLKRMDADLSPKGSVELASIATDRREPFVYRGSSLLTPHVADQFLSRIDRYLHRMHDQQPQAPSDLSPRWDAITPGEDYGSKSTIELLIARLQSNPPDGLGTDTILQLGDALKRLQEDNFFCLAQRLSGFNEALLMHKQTLRIQIRDPIGFEESRLLAGKVEAALAGGAYATPQPLQYFSPIRTGELRVKRLRLISTFGRYLNLECDRVVTATPMQPQSSGGAAIFLPPRLVQPARLQFRWLAADGEEREMNAHPDSSPLCGWAIANYLDNNLFFYSGRGLVLGYMEVEAKKRVRWRPAPGAGQPIIRLDQIENEHLRRLAAFFLGGSADYFNQFLQDLKAAQERIEPEHSGEPLPMGQPLALVRATLSLELQGLPALHQGWMQFRDNMSRFSPDTSKFTCVRFPIRLGEQEQLNDGLAVYWLEDEDGSYNESAYIIPNYDEAASAQEKKCDFLYQSIDAPPLNVTMLMDPRGVVHAATGILPSKAIQIPPHQYADAFKAFEMTFLAAPILAGKPNTTGEETIGLPVTDPPGYQWSWLEKQGDRWVSPSIHAADLFIPFAGKTEAREGWLKLMRRPDGKG